MNIFFKPICLRIRFDYRSGIVWEAEVEIPVTYMVGRFADDLEGYFFSIPEGVPALDYPMRRM